MHLGVWGRVLSLRAGRYILFGNMSERERPAVPAHLREGLPSAAQYEINALREYQIDNLRWRLQVTPENFEANEMIRRYVSVYRDTEAMVDRLQMQELRTVVASGTPLFTQLGQARMLYTAERMLLAEGFEGSVQVRVLGSTLDNVVRRHGLQVWPMPWVVEEVPDRPFIEPTELWTSTSREPMPTPPWKHPEGEPGWYWPDMPNQRHDPEHMKALQHEGECQGIPGALASFDPSIQQCMSRCQHWSTGGNLSARQRSLKACRAPRVSSRPRSLGCTELPASTGWPLRALKRPSNPAG